MTKKELLNKLRRLKNALPTDLVYINRVIDSKYVQSPDEYKVSTIDEFLEKDIQAVVSLGGSIIRPILGMFGSGKTTILNRIENILPRIISVDKYHLIRLNLEDVPVVRHDEFIKVLMKQIFPILETKNFRNLLEKTKEEELIEIFQSFDIIKKIKGLYSSSDTERINSKAYFYDKIEEERIFQVVEGLIQLAEKNEEIVVILVDELESLIKQDTTGVLTEIIVSRFLRGILDRHKEFVYIAFTCFKEKYDELKDKFYKFYRITEGNEIKLGDLSDKEKKELTEKILEETMEFTFGKISVEDILGEFRGTLDFYMSNVIKIIVSRIFQYIDQLEEIWKEVQDIYEKNARQKVAIPHLISLGFSPGNIANKVEEVAGYNFDIFANETDRNRILKRAFGEIKSVQCHKGWAEKFCSWMDTQLLLKSPEYDKERDSLLFIAPDYTSEAIEILEEKRVKCLTYQDVTVNNILANIKKRELNGLTDEERKVIEYIIQTKSKSRSFSVMEKKYSIELLKSLVKKGKLIIKKTAKTKKLCIKK
ncbi:MAG: hypothetical protein ACFFDN_52330 [Candidatus Hodarchaeota archaeon]